MARPAGAGRTTLAAPAHVHRSKMIMILVMNHPRLTSALAVTAGLAILAGCGSDDGGSSKDSADRLAVVATTTQLGDIVREIGGPAVDVTQILQPNTDPHEYEPRPRDVERAGNARLIVRSGDDLDGWVDQITDAVGGDAQVLDAGAGRPDTLPGESSGAEASKYDPHWWHDPANVEYAVGRIRDALVKDEPAQADAIRRGADAYLAKVRALDAGIKRCMDAVPATQRKLVTDHDAFGYFAKRYGIQVIGAVIPAQSTRAQPSAKDTADLVALIEREQVKAVFPETSANKRLVQAVARETGARADLVLYGDTLGPAGSPGATYLTMEQANADAMVRGFTGGAQGCSISGI